MNQLIHFLGRLLEEILWPPNPLHVNATYPVKAPTAIDTSNAFAGSVATTFRGRISHRRAGFSAARCGSQFGR
jgi:hypothetical protein